MAGATALDAGSSNGAVPTHGARPGLSCGGTAADGREYYSIRLEPTRNLPRSQDASGRVTVSFRDSPFDLALTADGTYVYDLRVTIDGLSEPAGGGAYVVWVTAPALEPVYRLGVLRPGVAAQGTVTLDKFLVFVTREPSVHAAGDRWTGPVLLKGRSRSARMRSMAGHGFFEQEPC